MIKDSPLSGLKRVFQVTINLSFFLFLLTTIAFLVWGSPSHLARLGAAWIAFVVFFFGVTQFIIIQINLASKGKGMAASMYAEKIGPHIFSDDKGWRNYISEKGELYNEPLKTKEEIQEILDDFESAVTTELYVVEIIIIALATLLTGFGDLLFCIVRFNGGQQC